jgi:hypothetical protein
MSGEPRADLKSMRRADVVAQAMDHRDVHRNFTVPRCQKGRACLLPCAFSTVPINRAGTGGQGRKAGERPGVLVHVLSPVGTVPGLSRPGVMLTGTKFSRGLLITREYDFIRTEWARVELDELEHEGIKHGVPWLPRGAPEMMAPGLGVCEH